MHTSLIRSSLAGIAGALGLVLCTGGAAAAPAKAASLAYKLKIDSKVSVAIYDQDGGIVRQLLLAAPRSAGEHVEEWDGLDQKDRPVAAGEYRWKLLSSQGLKAEWIVSLGTNLNPGWQIMPGNHVGAVRAAVDANGDICIMGGCSECVPGMARVTRDGKRLWASDHLLESNNDCGTGLAGGRLFSLLGNAKVIALDPATGKGQWKIDTAWNDVKDQWGPGSAVVCLAARGNELVIANKKLNVIFWLDPADGHKLDEAAVPAPQAVALDGKGNVLVISAERSVVRLSRAAKTPQPVLADLVSPSRLDVDPASGDIILCEAGANQQIKRFSGDGKLLATFGRQGGRLYGAYEPRDFRGVTGVTADKDGGFIVIEGNAAPRRVVFFDRGGKLLQEWYGGVHYANNGTADPNDASLVWYHSGSGEVVKARIDYVAKRYQVLEVYKLIGIGDGIIHGGNSMDTFTVRHAKGNTYLVNGNVEPRIVKVDAANRQLVPVVSAKYFMLHDFANPNYTPRVFVEAYFGGTVPDKPKYGAVKDAAQREAVMWTDLNGDGKPQADEMIFSPRKLMTWSNGRIWADANMNLYEMNDRPMVWRPKGWTKDGAPIYGGWADWQPLGEKPKWFNPLKVTWPAGSGVIPLSDGGLVGFFNSEENPFGKGMGSENIGGNYIVKWDKSGKALWYTGLHSPDFGAGPGEARFFWNIAGQAHNCIVVTDMQCYFTVKNLVYVWDPDGLWVGRLLENPDLKAAPEEAYNLATENFGGSLMEITRKNKVPGLNVGDAVFFGAGQNATPVYRITGWETFRRNSGTITVTPEQTEQAKLVAFQNAAKKSGAGKQSRQKKFVAGFLPRLATPPVLDGKLDDDVWKKAGVVDDFRLTPAEEDPAPCNTTILAGYDDTNLYLAVRAKETLLDKLRSVGSPLHLDDSVELFMDVGCTRSTYYQAMVNGAGTYMVGYGWAPRPEIKISTKAGREADAWVVELAVPWAQLKAKAPAPGEKLGFNVVRNRFTAGEEHSNWSPLRGNLNHTPGYFGTLYVGDTLPREAVALIAGNAFVRNLKDTPMPLNGSLDKWKGVRPLKILDGAKPVAEVYLGWKSDGLYAAFDVTTAAPWKNTAAFDMAFNGGAAVDLNLGPLERPDRKTTVGDVRFLAASLDGTTQVVEFLKLLTADLAAGDRAVRKYHTDAQGDNVFERLALLPAGTAAVKAKSDGKGYIVEMRVPLRAPLKLASGQKFRFDASLILANAAGNRAELRLPWFSTSGDDMFVATDVVVESSLRPWNWGVAELE